MYTIIADLLYFDQIYRRLIMNKKIIFLDVDGTLVDFRGELPRSAREAVEEAKRRGHRLVVCTGRLKAQIYPQVLALGFDGIIASAGAYVECDGKVIYHHVVDSEHLRKMTDYFEAADIPYCYQTENGIIATESSKKRIDQHFMDGGMDEDQVKKVMVVDTRVVDNISDCRDVEKGNYYDSGRTVGEIQEGLGDYFKAEASSYEKGDGDSGEFTCAGVNKATGITHYVKYVGGDMKDTIAFGDGPNDTEMLSSVELSVAMGNSSDDLKALADVVTDDVGEDGLKNAFRKLGII